MRGGSFIDETKNDSTTKTTRTKISRLLVSFFFVSVSCTAVAHEPPTKRNNNVRTRTRTTATVNQSPMIHGKIIGGQEIEEEYSFLVALMKRRSYDDSLYHLCGATLIAPDLVLSAAHCAYDPIPDAVQIGRLNLEDGTEFYEELEIIEEILHPGYDTDTSEHDLVIYKIETSIYHKPIPLNEDYTLPRDGIPMIVMGWGKRDDGSYPDHAFEATVDYVSTETCKKVYGEELFEEFMMCAVGKDGQDNCSGDSGGPLIIKDYFGENQHLLVGVVSWGRKCGDPYFPSVYANVTAEMDWIKDSMCELTDLDSVKAKVCPAAVTPPPEKTSPPPPPPPPVPNTSQPPPPSSSKCDNPSTLAETTWIVINMPDEMDVVGPVQYGSTITTTFTDGGSVYGSGETGFVYGVGGCNTYVGRYLLGDTIDSIDVDERMAITQNSCLQSIRNQENEFIEAMFRATSYIIDCNELKMFNKDGFVILTYFSDPPSSSGVYG